MRRKVSSTRGLGSTESWGSETGDKETTSTRRTRGEGKSDGSSRGPISG